MASIEENKLKKRNKILDAAYDLFAKKGINMTAVDDVVKCAGIAKGTFYLYFHDKYDLLDQIILHKSAEIIKSVISQMREIETADKLKAIDMVLFFVDAIIDYMKDNREILTIINQKISLLYTMIMDDESENVQEDIKYLINIISNLGYTYEEAKKGIYLLSSMICSVCSNAIISGKPFAIEEIRPEIHIIVKKILL